MISPSDLIHEIVIEGPVQVQDATGAQTETWQTFAEPYAAIKWLRGREFFAAQQFSAERWCRISIYWIDGVNEKMRIRFGSRIFDIKFANNVDELNQDLELMCIERNP
jgi:SPP1 family predicted phage head-tail adaptor